MHRLLRVGLGAALWSVLLGLLVVGPFAAGAQSSESEARAERERIRAERADAAAELDAARAEDAEVLSALNAITVAVTAQEEEMASIQRGIDEAAARQLDAEVAIAELDADADILETRLADLAIRGFVTSSDQGSSPLLDGDFSASLRQQALLESVGGNAVAVLEEIRVLRGDAEALRAEAAAAAADAQALEAERAVAVAELAEIQTLQAELRAEMAARVSEWEGLVAELDAEDAELTELINRLATPAPRPGGAAPQPGEASVSGFQWPINAPISSGFGYRVHPIFGTRRLHKGIDQGASTGTPIAAAKGGTVISSGWQNGYGNTVVIDHGSGITTLYAHQSQLGVSAGDRVNRGDVIGYVGSTGNSTGPHLHFEIRSNGTAIDPVPYLP